MIKIERTEVVGWEHAIRGMRNPLNSWDKSDSTDCAGFSCKKCPFKKDDNKCMVASSIIGENDLSLMQKLVKAGTDHRKFMRMITVYCDITAPMYWWKEFDTYKVGTVRNSCSTMHKITAKKFEADDFSHEHLIVDSVEVLNEIIEMLNECREACLNFDYYQEHGDFVDGIDCEKDIWWQIIQLLPSSYNQRSTVMLNYEVLANMYHSRKNHKLDEWREFCRWVETLPYSELITGKENCNAD